MGYESRLYVVKKSEIAGRDAETEGKYWCEVIATINLCKMGGDFRDKLYKYPATDSFFYTENETVVEDKYGEPLKEIPIRDMVNILERQKAEDIVREGVPYRRLEPAISLLKGFDPEQWGAVTVLHYGY